MPPWEGGLVAMMIVAAAVVEAASVWRECRPTLASIVFCEGHFFLSNK